MNLRQQFYWKILVIVSLLGIFWSSMQAYFKYSEISTNTANFKEEIDKQEKSLVQFQAEFILNKQFSRMNIEPNYALIQDKAIMDHIRAGLKTNSMKGDSKDPIYKGRIVSKSAKMGHICMIEYRNTTQDKYEIGDTISGSNMVIQSCNERYNVK